jgi:site-specific DNA recombinase
VLLSFAQFEREVIGERVRDKISASKRKGLWVGGPIPLGYASVNKKLVIVPQDAETVRTMFRLYLECGSVGALAQELARRDIVSKVRTFSSGRSRGGGRYGVGARSTPASISRSWAAPRSIPSKRSWPTMRGSVMYALTGLQRF